MHDNLGICFAFKVIPLTDQFLPQFQIVFNDSVMNHRKPPVITGMGMGIGIRGCTVGSPAGMTDTGGARKTLSVIRLLRQTRNSSGYLADGYVSLLHNCNSGRVISTVFQFF